MHGESVVTGRRSRFGCNRTGRSPTIRDRHGAMSLSTHLHALFSRPRPDLIVKEWSKAVVGLFRGMFVALTCGGKRKTR